MVLTSFWRRCQRLYLVFGSSVENLSNSNPSFVRITFSIYFNFISFLFYSFLFSGFLVCFMSLFKCFRFLRYPKDNHIGF